MGREFITRHTKKNNPAKQDTGSWATAAETELHLHKREPLGGVFNFSSMCVQYIPVKICLTHTRKTAYPLITFSQPTLQSQSAGAESEGCRMQAVLISALECGFENSGV